jgi:hypothetical protein
MFRTALTAATIVTALGVSGVSAGPAQAYKYILKDAIVTSAQPTTAHGVSMENVLVSSYSAGPRR